MNKYILFVIIINSIIICDDPMNYIIDNIYLGDSVAAGDEEYLKQYNITAVVNCAQGIVSIYQDVKFIELNLYDEFGQDLFPKFEIAYKFIKKNSQNNILIHCVLGMSRSASLVAFYLMKEKGWDYDTCYAYMKERRPIVDPIPSFADQLRDYYNKFIKKWYLKAFM